MPARCPRALPPAREVVPPLDNTCHCQVDGHCQWAPPAKWAPPLGPPIGRGRCSAATATGWRSGATTCLVGVGFGRFSTPTRQLVVPEHQVVFAAADTVRPAWNCASSQSALVGAARHILTQRHIRTRGCRTQWSVGLGGADAGVGVAAREAVEHAGQIAHRRPELLNSNDRGTELDMSMHRIHDVVTARDIKVGACRH